MVVYREEIELARHDVRARSGREAGSQTGRTVVERAWHVTSMIIRGKR